MSVMSKLADLPVVHVSPNVNPSPRVRVVGVILIPPLHPMCPTFWGRIIICAAVLIFGKSLTLKSTKPRLKSTRHYGRVAKHQSMSCQVAV